MKIMGYFVKFSEKKLILILLLVVPNLSFSLAHEEICLICNCVFVNITGVELKPGEFSTFHFKADAVEPFNANITYESLQKYFYVDCSENNVGQIDIFDWPKLKVLGVLGNFLNSKLMRLEPFSGVIRRQMMVLSLAQNLISEIRDVELDEFTNLKMLNLSQNKIEQIKKGSFSRLSFLEIVDLSGNWLAELEDWAFYGTNIRYLNLSKNAITHLTQDVFRGLNNLTVLDLSENELTKLPDEFGNVLPTLTWLSLKNNYIQRLSELPKELKTLDVSNNNVLDLLLVHQNLEILYVVNNDIVSLSHANFPELRVLVASHNNLTELSALQNNKIRILDISHNRFYKIPDIATSEKLPFLEELYFDGNPIVNATFPAQNEPFFSLRVLGLSHLKHVNKIQKNMFQGLFPTVKYDCSMESGILIDLSHNSIKSVDEDAFRMISVCGVSENRANLRLAVQISCQVSLGNTLEKFILKTNNTIPSNNGAGFRVLCALRINLSNNHLKSLSKDLLPWFQMSYINLQENPWHCDCSIQWMLDDFLTFMYANSPRQLFELRCSTPLRYKNKMFVHWYGKSDSTFCSSGPSSFLLDLGGGKEVEIRTASAIACVSLICVILIITVVLIVVLCTRPSKKNRPTSKSSTKGPPFYKKIPNNSSEKSEEFSEKWV